MSDDEVRSDEEAECQYFPSFVFGGSGKDRWGEMPWQDWSDTPQKSVVSTSATPDTVSRRGVLRSPATAYRRRHAFSTSIGSPRGSNSQIPSPPSRASPASARSQPTHRSQPSERFLKLQQDLRRAGLDVSELELSQFSLDAESLHRSGSPRIKASQVDEGEATLRPQLLWCPHCRSEVVTEVAYSASSTTWYFALSLASTGICLSGGFLGCCLIPYCTKSCQKPEVLCSKCRHRLR